MKKKLLIEKRQKTVIDLQKEVVELKRKLAKFSVNLMAGRESNLKVGKEYRRDIAQILGIIRELETK